MATNNSQKKSKKTIYTLFTIITIITVLLDQITKIIVKHTNPNISFLLFKLHYTTNTGAGFSILQNNAFILGLMSLAFVIAVLIYYKHIPKTKTYQIGTALLLGGAIGNMIDRLFRHEVIDFLGSTFWPSFNIADAAITIAAILLITQMIKEEIKASKMSKK